MSSSVPELKLKDLPTADDITNRYRFKVQRYVQTGKTPEEALKIIEEKATQARMFLGQGSQMLEDSDKKLIEKLNTKLKVNAGLSVVAAVGLNIGLSKIKSTPSFRMPRSISFLLRIGCFCGPLIAVIRQNLTLQTRMELYLTDKYEDRIEVFKRSGDDSLMNPFSDTDLTPKS